MSFTLESLWDKFLASVEKIDLKEEEYLRIPVNPDKSLIIFLMKLALVIGKGALKDRSGSWSVSVNLWCLRW